MRKPEPLQASSAAAALAALACTAFHLARNAAPPSYDDAWYLETSFRLFSALKAGPLAFGRAYVEALRIKAPLLALVPLPLYAVFGMGERVAVWANLPLAALAAWAWSRAAAEWWREHPRGRDAAVLAGALAALLPLAYGLSRVFFAETLVSALLALTAWRCAAAKASDRREGFRLGLLLGLGLLAKSTFPLLAAGFVWPARERLKPHAKTALLVGGVLAATWYAFNLPYVAGYAWSAGFGSVARGYAGRGGLGARLDWLASIARDGFSWPLAAAMAAVAAAASGGRRPRLDDGARLALWGAVPLLAYAAGVNREPRLVAPLLPLGALLAARTAVSLERPRARALAAGTLLLAGLAVCAEQTFFAPPESALAYNGAPSADTGWDRGAVVAAAARAAGEDGVAAVALEHARLNANNLSSLAAARGLTLRFVSLGYAQSSAEGALIRLKDKGAGALVLVDGASDAPPEFNRANAGMAEAVDSGRLHAERTERVALAPGITAAIYRLSARK